MLVIYFVLGASVFVVAFYIAILRQSLREANQRLKVQLDLTEMWQYRFDRHLTHSRKTIERMRIEFEQKFINRRIQLYEVYYKTDPSKVFLVAICYHESPPVLTLDSVYPESEWNRRHYGKDFALVLNGSCKVT